VLVAAAAAVGQSVLPLELQSGQAFAAPETSAGGSHCPAHLHHHTVRDIQTAQSSIPCLLLKPFLTQPNI
jgi:hypothetical protein